MATKETELISTHGPIPAPVARQIFPHHGTRRCHREPPGTGYTQIERPFIFGEIEMEMIKTFAKSESGAVTVDWVVLTAAIVGLGLAVMAVVANGIEDLSGNISQTLTDTQPLENPFANDDAGADPAPPVVDDNNG
jgi:hypothetical protein